VRGFFPPDSDLPCKKTIRPLFPRPRGSPRVPLPPHGFLSTRTDPHRMRLDFVGSFISLDKTSVIDGPPFHPLQLLGFPKTPSYDKNPPFSLDSSPRFPFPNDFGPRKRVTLVFFPWASPPLIVPPLPTLYGPFPEPCGPVEEISFGNRVDPHTDPSDRFFSLLAVPQTRKF